jgi:hypothetical protein
MPKTRCIIPVSLRVVEQAQRMKVVRGEVKPQDKALDRILLESVVCFTNSWKRFREGRLTHLILTTEREEGKGLKLEERRNMDLQ